MTDATPQAALLSEAAKLADELDHEASKRACNVAMMPASLPVDAAKELRRLDALVAHLTAKLQATQAEPVQAGELPDERAAFEQWASDNGEFPRAVARSGDVYHLMATQTYWLAWQARAALSARKPLTDETFVAACNGCPTPGKCKDTSGCASAGMNVPTYYVRHPDDTYTAADPQPRFNGIGLEVKP